MHDKTARSLDPLYGPISFEGPIVELMHTPVVQRLREIRLSNIDSIAMPGIANVSRYEHVVGAAHLASRVGFFKRLSEADALILQAAALLHDAAIAPFGHLVEEALQYAGVTFSHETKFRSMLEGARGAEVGGVELQIYAGRESGIRRWTERAFGGGAEVALRDILESIEGNGRFGGCIAGGLDVDNLDNLSRIAFHMGLVIDRGLPVRIAAGMVANNRDGKPEFSAKTVDAVRGWLSLRREVYSHLMLAREDFTGKAMLVSATVRAFENGDLSPELYTWTLTDREIIDRLRRSGDRHVRNAVDAWLTGELWPLADLIWLKGDAPDLASVYTFGGWLSQQLGRPAFAYRIGDKRVRRISLSLENGERVVLGERPSSWVLGVVSRKRGEFSIAENQGLRRLASEFFACECLAPDDESKESSLPLFRIE